MSIVNAPVAYETKSTAITGTAKTIADFAFDADYLAVADFMSVTVEGCDLKFYVDGQTPTAANGLIALTDTQFEVRGLRNILNFKFIARSSTGTITAMLSGYGRAAN